MRPELIFVEGRIHDPSSPGAAPLEALAVAAGRVLATGTQTEILALRGPRTEVVDLDGGMLLPGFQDAHVHPLHGGLAGLRCDLYATTTPAQHLAAIRSYAEAHPDLEWIVGGGWSMDDFGGVMPTRHLLDELLPGRPIALETRDGHSTWLSTRALELAGLLGGVDLPHGAVVERESDGTPAGTVHELLGWLDDHVLPPVRPDEWDTALACMQRELHGLGITAVQEANATPELVEAYLRASSAATLTLRVEGNLAWDRERGDEQLAELVERRRLAVGPRLRLRGAKLFQDGVVESHTAAMLEAYRGVAGLPAGAAGASLYAPDELCRIVELLDAEEFQVHVHTIGDRAVREALDAIRAARESNGARGARHHLAHVQFVHPSDLPRFAALGVVANVTPLWAVRSGYVEELTLPFVSEAAGTSMYPFGSLLRAGARLAFGSDWSVSSPDPLQQLEVAATRCPPGEPDGDPFLPDERLDLRTAIHAATAGSAYVNGLDGETGTFEVGASADLVVLDTDLLAPDAPPPTAARVLLTLVAGDVVHDAR